MIFRIIFVWIFIALGEVINGNFRVRYLQRKFNQKKAKQLSFFSGTVIIYIISWLSLSWIGPSDFKDCFIIGLIWMILMLLLDFYFAFKVFHYKWKVVLDDFNLLKGNLLGLGMILLLFAPYVVFFIKN